MVPLWYMVLISYFVWGDMACMDRGVRLPLPTHCSIRIHYLF